MPNSITYLNLTHVFEWHQVRCGSKNKCQKDITCLKEFGLHAQNMITILDSIVSINGGGRHVRLLNENENLHFTSE